ncbi:hypothetical protein [Planococcus antarcticus]|uniref:hypothetical protein n=1 Tax=Planococcus antarcticus TaxID=161360 RepID=UPI001389D223|nr:hypothetical protein [Planococcus antarcticus]
MALYIIANDHPNNNDAQEDIYQLSSDLFQVAEAVLKYEEISGDGLLIDLNPYKPL